MQVRLADTAGGDRLRAVWRVSGPGVFDTLRIPLLRGRGFADSDVLEAPGVVVVNDAFVRAYMPPGETVGRRLTESNDAEVPQWRTIVGVIADVRQQDWASAAEPEIHVPLAQTPSYLTDRRPHVSMMTLVARGRDDDAAQLAPRVVDLRLVSADRRLALRDEGLLGLEFLLGDELFFLQLPQAGKITASGVELGLILRQLGLHLGESNPVRRGIDFGQQLALFDLLTFLEHHPQQLALDAAVHGDGVQRRHGPNRPEVDGEIVLASDDRAHRNRDGARPRRAKSEPATSPLGGLGSEPEIPDPGGERQGYDDV